MHGPLSSVGLDDTFAGTALKRLSSRTACAALVNGADGVARPLAVGAGLDTAMDLCFVLRTGFSPSSR